MAEAKIVETVCEDRISALPDNLLETILLHVPVKNAIATMILSKRWRFIWMMLPRLEYDEDDNDDESKKSSWWVFEKSMELHKAPVLETLIFKLGPGCPSDADVGKWLAKAVDRRVVVLKFKLSWSTGPTRLPKSLYSCETLEELTLSHKILVDFPSSNSLPSLRLLELLYVVYKDEASLVRLLSHCPVLKILIVRRNRRNWDDNVTKFSVKIPSLKLLCYRSDCEIDDSPLPGDHDVVDTGRCLAIDTPALQVIHIIDYSGDSCSIENMPCLENAWIDVSFPDIDRSKTSLSAVMSLVLFMTDQVLMSCSTVNFSRLIKLSICPHRLDWLEPLLLLLENAPKLKDLLVNYELTSTLWDEIPLSWNQPSSIPRCLSSQLEIFEYREYGDREAEEKFVMYILANSKCLKTATIFVRPDLGMKHAIIKELRNIPRVSTTSQLLLK